MTIEPRPAADGPLPTLDIGLPGWTLRAWRRDDATALALHAGNAEVWRWMSDGFPHPYTREIAEHWVARGHVEFGGDHWAIACDDKAVGGAGIQPQSHRFRCNAEVGWWLAQAHWGRGIAARVAGLLAKRAFADPGITRVVAPIHAGNLRSMHVALKSGFRLEGVQPQSVIKAGRVIDCWVFARYREASSEA